MIGVDFSFPCKCLYSGWLCEMCEEVAAEMRQEVTLVQLGAKPNASIALLQSWLNIYPELVAIKNGNEIHISREQLCKRLKVDFPGVVITSVERGFKHAGLEVTQTTHRGMVKIWQVKLSDDAKPPKKRFMESPPQTLKKNQHQQFKKKNNKNL
jgi:hypothetical protein